MISNFTLSISKKVLRYFAFDTRRENRTQILDGGAVRQFRHPHHTNMTNKRVRIEISGIVQTCVSHFTSSTIPVPSSCNTFLMRGTLSRPCIGRRNHVSSLIYLLQSLTVTLETNNYLKRESVFELSIEEKPPLSRVPTFQDEVHKVMGM